MMTECGGCAGLGAHVRWCPEKVGPRASALGRRSEQAEALGDAVGSLAPSEANGLYRISGELRDQAARAALEWRGEA